MRDNTKLRAFILADEVTLLSFHITKTFPKEEVYGLTTQVRRANVKAKLNIIII